jgi:hypothetical protein
MRTEGLGEVRQLSPDHLEGSRDNLNVCPVRQALPHHALRLGLLFDDNQFETFDGNWSRPIPEIVDLKLSSRLKQARTTPADATPSSTRKASSADVPSSSAPWNTPSSEAPWARWSAKITRHRKAPTPAPAGGRLRLGARMMEA